jgi:glutamyl-Q tRNA(Asp) synthetase
MEDLDRARVIGGCATQMLRTLEAFGLHWDGAIEYQSACTAAYEAALQQLQARALTFECSCSRRELTDAGGYPGTCRAGPRTAGPTATRFRVPEGSVGFEDRVQGSCKFELAERGDVIIRRRDKAFAYQLAVVVDDARQGVTDVVRGADLLDSTPWQISLQRALQLPTPRYAHLPLVTEPGGARLAKSRRSVALESAAAGAQLWQALALLRQHPPAELKLKSPAQILPWAVEHWSLAPLRGLRQVSLPAA